MRKLFFILMLISLLPSVAIADSYTLYFTRHMEKTDEKTDPELSLIGQQRARLLAQTLKNSNIEVIFSTQFKRTRLTAEPLAKYLNVSVENYPSKDLEGIVTSIKALQKNALIVGHSNTVSELVKAAGGSAKVLKKDDYGDLFQVVISGDDVVTNRLYIPVLQ
ncbi:MAG: histidine phosphatase family protein [Pseudomonadota bacterium]